MVVSASCVSRGLRRAKCSLDPALARDIVIDGLLMAVWKRKPKERVIVHLDQGSQYGSDVWMRFCKAHKLNPSMSRRGNCWDNAVAESFFSSLKKESGLPPAVQLGWFDSEPRRSSNAHCAGCFSRDIAGFWARTFATPKKKQRGWAPNVACDTGRAWVLRTC
jgi:transposase InsO family protein